VNLEAMERVLATGVIVPGSARVIGHGSSGLVQRVLLRDIADATQVLPAAIKQAHAPQEQFAWKLARALGIEHLVPAVGRRNDGTVAMQFIDGAALDSHGIRDGLALRRSLTSRYVSLGHDPQAAKRLARTDHELLEVFDWLIANRDRKPANTLHQAAEGASYFIDHGGALRGELDDVLRPRLKDHFYLTDLAMPHRITISDEVRQLVSSRLTDDVIRDAWLELRKPAGRLRGQIDELVLERARSDHQLERLLARRDALVQRGWLEYEPVTEMSRRTDTARLRHEMLTGHFDTWAGVRLITGGGARG
jgi:hypothetical protein